MKSSSLKKNHLYKYNNFNNYLLLTTNSHRISDSDLTKSSSSVRSSRLNIPSELGERNFEFEGLFYREPVKLFEPESTLPNKPKGKVKLGLNFGRLDRDNSPVSKEKSFNDYIKCDPRFRPSRNRTISSLNTLKHGPNFSKLSKTVLPNIYPDVEANKIRLKSITSLSTYKQNQQRLPKVNVSQSSMHHSRGLNEIHERNLYNFKNDDVIIESDNNNKLSGSFSSLSDNELANPLNTPLIKQDDQSYSSYNYVNIDHQKPEVIRLNINLNHVIPPVSGDSARNEEQGQNLASNSRSSHLSLFTDESKAYFDLIKNRKLFLIDETNKKYESWRKK